jgi:hypothetical protein
MVINQDGLVFRVGKQMPMGERPVRLVTAHSLFNRVVGPAFGLLWTTLALGLVLDMLHAGETWGLLMPGVFLLIGFFILLFGFRAMFWSRIVTLGTDVVYVVERGTQAGTNWQEPLTTYRGVAPLSVEVKRGKRSFPMPAIVLDHDDPLMRIVLWSSLSSRCRDEACRDYADWLGLPVVEPLRHKAPSETDDRAAVQRG